MGKTYTLDDLAEIVETLRSDKGCPWDRQQTHESLRTCMIEEAYEVVDSFWLAKSGRMYPHILRIGCPMADIPHRKSIAEFP